MTTGAEPEFAPFGTDEWIVQANEELKAKPCRRCGKVGGMVLEKLFAAKPLGTWSLAGMQDKVVGNFELIMSHEDCGLRGRISLDQGE